MKINLNIFSTLKPVHTSLSVKLEFICETACMGVVITDDNCGKQYSTEQF